MKKLSVFFFILIVSCSDQNKIPGNILSKDKMQAVLWSMISAGEYLDGYVFTKDSVDKTAESTKIYSRVFQVHKITKESFDISYQYYRDHPDLMKVMLDSLSKRQSDPAKYQPWGDSVRMRLIDKETVE